MFVHVFVIFDGMFFFEGYGAHVVLHVLTDSCPTGTPSAVAASAQAGQGGLGQRGAGQVSIGVITAEQQRAEPVGVSGVALGEVVAGIEQDLQRFAVRSEEHTSELQSLMRISYAVFCLKKKKTLQMPNNQDEYPAEIL